jgi:hypothetical protein
MTYNHKTSSTDANMTISIQTGLRPIMEQEGATVVIGSTGIILV